MSYAVPPSDPSLRIGILNRRVGASPHVPFAWERPLTQPSTLEGLIAGFAATVVLAVLFVVLEPFGFAFGVYCALGGAALTYSSTRVVLRRAGAGRGLDSF